MKVKHGITLGALIGTMILAFAAVAYDLPGYGWVLLLLMVVIFFKAIFQMSKTHKGLAWESLQLEAVQEGNIAEEGSHIAKRQQWVSSSSDVLINRNAFAEIAAASEESRLSDGSGYVLTTLGLIGTFYGLGEVINFAGSQISGGDVDISVVISVIFKNMLGIFASSLCGLSLALTLFSLRSLLQKQQNQLLTDLEEYTQFVLLPSSVEKEENPLESPLEALKSEISRFRKDFAEEVVVKFGGAAEALQNTVSNLEIGLKNNLTESQKEWSVSWSNLLDKHTSSFQSSMKDQFEIASSKGEELWKGLAASVENNFDSLLKQHKESLDLSISSSSESLQGFQTEIAMIPEKNKETLDGFKEALQETLKGLQNSFQSIPATNEAVLKEFAESLSNKVETITATFSSLPNTIESWQNATQDQLGHLSEELSQRNSELVQQVSSQSGSLLKGFEGFALEMQKSVDKLNNEGLERITSQFGDIANSASNGLGQAIEVEKQMHDRMNSLALGLEDISLSMGSASDLMKVNQVEFQSSLEMFNSGVESLLTSFQQNDEKDDFMRRLESTLEAFHEKASDVLIENSVRTQEILLEVLAKGEE